MPPNNILYNSGVFVDVDIERDSINHGERQSDFETAISYAGIGKFQSILLMISGMIYATCAISSTTLSFVLPSAKCDFELTSADKGRLSATPLIGMLVGCCFWGTIANSQGRKGAIIISLLMDFLAALISSFAENYRVFLVCRFFNGFGIIGATTLIFSYLGEFLSVKHRDKYLGKLEIFWNIGVIILPVLAWALLNKTTMQIFQDGGNFSPWRVFVLVCSLPSLLSAVSLYFLPETPKFLISRNQYVKARLVFQKIYSCNTGLPEISFPVKSLEGEQNNNQTSLSLDSISSEKVQGLSKYLKYLTITCVADFGLMSSYYTLVMWFPELFDRMSDFQSTNSDSAVSVCMVSNSTRDYEEFTCEPTIESKVFLDTLVVGLSCIPTSVSLSYLMYKIGKKFVLVSSLVLSGTSTLALNWVTTTTQTLVLSCIFEALTSILEAVLFCVVVDLFPTNLRALALTITATSGRLGAIFGNIIFGALLDINCVIPIYLFGFLLILSGILCTAVPKNQDYITIH